MATHYTWIRLEIGLVRLDKGQKGWEDMEMYIERSASLDKEQEALWYFGGLRIIKTIEEQIDESCKIFEYVEPAGTVTYSYAPYQEDTAFYIVEGEMNFSSGNTSVRATPGTFLFLPRNVCFRSQVTASGPARLLTWTTSMGFAHRALNMGVAGQALVLSPPHMPEEEKMQQLTTMLRNTTQFI